MMKFDDLPVHVRQEVENALAARYLKVAWYLVTTRRVVILLRI